MNQIGLFQIARTPFEGDDGHEGKKATLESLTEVDHFLKERNQMGILVGGTLTKPLPRKDIDVIVSAPDIEYDELGVDWWQLDASNNLTENINDIVVPSNPIITRLLAKRIPGLCIFKDLYKVSRHNLPVKYTTSKKELSKPGSRILDNRLLQPIIFKTDGEVNIGILGNYDSEFLEFHDCVNDADELIRDMYDGIYLNKKVIRALANKIVNKNSTIRGVIESGEAFRLATGEPLVEFLEQLTHLRIKPDASRLKEDISNLISGACENIYIGLNDEEREGLSRCNSFFNSFYGEKENLQKRKRIYGLNTSSFNILEKELLNAVLPWAQEGIDGDIKNSYNLLRKTGILEDFARDTHRNYTQSCAINKLLIGSLS
jgi:hypothetical protein